MTLPYKVEIVEPLVRVLISTGHVCPHSRLPCLARADLTFLTGKVIFTTQFFPHPKSEMAAPGDVPMEPEAEVKIDPLSGDDLDRETDSKSVLDAIEDQAEREYWLQRKNKIAAATTSHLFAAAPEFEDIFDNKIHNKSSGEKDVALERTEHVLAHKTRVKAHTRSTLLQYVRQMAHVARHQKWAKEQNKVPDLPTLVGKVRITDTDLMKEAQKFADKLVQVFRNVLGG